MKISWRLGILAGVILALFALYPQFKLFYLRGNDWQGNYALNDIDEVAYASYLRALIDGRPRRNDPYTARDDSATTPQAESLFSIQFFAPYVVAIPARLFGISAPTAMTLAGAFAGFFAALTLFWLIASITGDSFLAFAATLVVLCGGALAAGEGAISEIFQTGIAYPYFPFLRRYIPAMGFPIIFALFACVWKMLESDDLKRRLIFCVFASLSFGCLVFTYFYLWTTALAWLAGITFLWLLIRPKDFWRDFKWLLIVDFTAILWLVPYGILLSNRSHTMDEVQLLVLTHVTDFWRVPEIISVSVIAMILISVLLKTVNFRENSTIFTVSFAIVPILVFNQQVITGRSLQPIHYQVFIGNYIAALGLVSALALVWKRDRKKLNSTILVGFFALVATIWGVVEGHYTVRISDDANVARDEWMPVARRLTELSANDSPTVGSERGVVYSTNLLLSDDLPTIAPQSVLWARHQHVFAGVTWQENKERYYQWLYYQGLDEDWLDSGLKNGDFVSMIALFGWGRHTDRLSSDFKPLKYYEVDEEVQRFAEYRKNFGLQQASNPLLSYVVVSNESENDLTYLDKWYQRDEGEVIGKFTLYKVKLRK